MTQPYIFHQEKTDSEFYHVSLCALRTEEMAFPVFVISHVDIFYIEVTCGYGRCFLRGFYVTGWEDKVGVA